jgi:hypothetical protein
LFYNRSVNNVTNATNITNVYSKVVVNNISVTNASYNGGAGGTTARPTAAEQAAARVRHLAPTAAQIQQEQGASGNHALLASVNHGKPTIAVTPKPGVFSGQGVLEAKAAAPYHPAVPAPAAKRAVPPGGTTAQPNTNPNGTAKPAEPSESKTPERPEAANPPNKPASQPPRKPEQPPKE